MNLLTKLLILLWCSALFVTPLVHAAACNDVFPPQYLENGPKLDVPSFPSFSSNNNRRNRYITLSPGTYKKIEINSFGTLTFNSASSGTDQFYIKELKIGYDSDVVFSPGDYWIESFKIEPFGYIRTSGTGQVRIFVKNKLELKERGYWDSNGSNFLIVAKDIKLKRGVYVNAVMYASNNFEGENTLHITGAIAAKQFKDNRFEPIFSHSQSLLDNTDFGSMCGDNEPFVPTVLLDMRFDEPVWNGTDSVLDSSGNNRNGTPINVTPTDSQFCRAAEFGNGQSSQRIKLDYQTLNGQRDFSIVAWVKTSSNQLQSILSAARSDLAANEVVALIEPSGINHRLWLNVQSSPFDRNMLSSQSRRIADDQWHQLVWTRDVQNSSTAQQCFFVDGASLGCRNTTVTGEVNLDPLGLVLGQEQDEVDGDFELNQSFRGAVDELLIVNWPLSSTEVNDIKTNIESGRTWDNKSRVCSLSELEAPVLDMRFEEPSFSGIDAVIDSSSNSFDGTAFNVDTYADGKYCGAANFIGTSPSQYMTVNKDVFDGARDFTVVAWIKTLSNNGQTFFSVANDSQANEAVTFIEGGFGTGRTAHRFWMTIMNSFFQNAQQSNNINELNDGDWHQVAFVRDTQNRQSCYYFDGDFVSCVTENDISALDVDAGGVYFGQEQDSLGGGFYSRQALDAYIDELLVFHKALNGNQIKKLKENIDDGLTWDGQGRTCRENLVDHYRFEMKASGLTCQASSITLKACSDDNCALVSTNVSANLNTPSGVTWSGSNVSANTVSFLGGKTSLNLANINAGTLTLGLNNRNPEATSATPVRCFVGSNEISNCGMNFSDSAFVFSDIPLQVSGKRSDQEFNATQLRIKALKKGDDYNQTGTCSNIFAPNTTVEVGFKYICDSPGMCNVNGVVISNNDTAPTVLIQESYKQVKLRFDNTVSAPFDIVYPDTGKLRLAAQLDDVSSPPISEALSGTSGEFIVKPFGLRLTMQPDTSITTNSGVSASDHNGTIYTKAGKPFKVDAEIVGWRAEQDTTPRDGYADITANLSKNNKISSLNWGRVALTHSLELPSGGRAGSFNTNFGENNGLVNHAGSEIKAQWSEVGIITLNAQLLDNDSNDALLLPWGNTLRGNLRNVGRFIPDHFALLEQKNGALSAQCTLTGKDDFAYIGALNGTKGALTYEVNPSVTIAAQNLANISVNNYQGNFNKLAAINTLIAVTEPINDPALNNAEPPAPMLVNSEMSLGTLAEARDIDDNVIKGRFIYRLADNDNFSFARDSSSKVAPFDSSFELKFSKLEDSDGVTLSSMPILLPQGVEMRFGRAFLQNAYGPEEQPLTVPLEYQYWDGERFIVSPADCSVYAQDNATLSPLDAGNQFGDIDQDDFSTTSKMSDNGVGGIALPASNLIGTVQMTVDVPAWLKFNWSGSTTFDEDPSAEVIFGRYRGNDRLINWREIR